MVGAGTVVIMLTALVSAVLGQCTPVPGRFVANGFDRECWDLTVWDDGSGPALFAGGSFTTVQGLPVSRIARFDGKTWSALPGTFASPSGLSSFTYPVVRSLCPYDDVSGPNLYVGGDFTGIAGLASPNLVRWDGTSWSAVGSGFNYPVHAMVVMPGPAGPALIVAGDGWVPGLTSYSGRVARWDGMGWTTLGMTDNAIWDLEIHDDGAGPQLFVGGAFG
jgi:hypothetical protein